MPACIGHSRVSGSDFLAVSKAFKMRESLEAQTLTLEHSQPCFFTLQECGKGVQAASPRRPPEHNAGVSFEPSLLKS